MVSFHYLRLGKQYYVKHYKSSMMIKVIFYIIISFWIKFQNKIFLHNTNLDFHSYSFLAITKHVFRDILDTGSKVSFYKLIVPTEVK